MTRPWRCLSLSMLVVVLMLTALHTPGRTQTPVSARYQQALDLMQRGDGAGAAAIFEAVAQENAGTQTEAQALLQLAFTHGRPLKNYPRARQIYQDVAQRFPNLTEGFVAQVNLLDCQLLIDGVPFSSYLAGLDALAVRAGGPALQVVGQGQRAASMPVSFMDTASQSKVLNYLYWTASSRMSYRPEEELTSQLLRQSLNIQNYTRDAFPLLAQGVSESIREDVLRLNGQPLASNDFPTDVNAPRILKVKPENKTGRRSTLVVKLHDGNIMESQVKLASLELILDGVNVANQARSITRSSRKIKKGTNGVFQRTKIKYRPATPLSVGQHQATVRVSDEAGNRVERTWTFTVAAHQLDEDDDEPGDDRCDTEPEDD